MLRVGGAFSPLDDIPPDPGLDHSANRHFEAGSTVASMPPQHLFVILPAVAVDIT
jgi:hypothetical protein